MLIYDHLLYRTPRQEMLAEAVKLAKDLIQTIKEEVEKRNQQNSYNRGYHYPVSVKKIYIFVLIVRCINAKSFVFYH